MITIRNKTIVFAILIAFILTLLLGGYLGRLSGDRASERLLNAIYDTINRKEIIIGGLRKQVAEISQIVISKDEAIKRGEIEKAELTKLYLKKVNELTRAELRINILLDSIEHNGTIITVHDTVTINDQKAILLPFLFSEKNKYLNLTGAVNKNGILSIGVTVPVELDVWTGVDKKTKQPKAVLTTTNPYVQIQSIRSVKMDVPKPKKWSVGVQGGYGVTDHGLSPYVGLGISRSVLRF